MIPSPLWSAASTATLSTVGILCRLFLYATQRKVEVQGLHQFLQLIRHRNGGLVTGEYILLILPSPPFPLSEALRERIIIAE